jgi:F-box interacting protein
VNCLIKNRSITIPKDPYFRLNDKDCSKIIGSCNELICLFDYSYEETTTYKEMWLRFWNPATRKISDKLGSDFNFGNSRYHWKYGGNFVFGYDNSTNTYKVVAVNFSGSNVRVFSLGDNVWRTIQSFPMLNLRMLNNSAVYDGVYFCCTINWLVYRPCLINDEHDMEFVIISVDLDTETYTEMLPPQGFLDKNASREERNVCVLMESLCFYYDFNQTDFVLWKMTEFGDEDSWVQFFRFSYNKIRMNYGSGPRPLIKLLPFHLSEDGETLILANNLQDQAILYNRRTNRARKTRINKKIRWFSIMDYVESLVSTS